MLPREFGAGSIESRHGSSASSGRRFDRLRHNGFDAAQALRLAQETFDIEAAAVLGLKARTGEAFARAVEQILRRARPRRRDGHGQERPHRPQDRRHAGFHRHAGDVRAPGRGQPRRPRHDQGGRPGAGDLQRRRKRGDHRDPAGAQAPGRAAGRDDRRRWTPRWPRHADIVLDSGVEKEACPLNLAPTASTTAQLALGDALAVALLDARGFKHRGLRALASRWRAGPQAADAPGRRDAHRRRGAARRARRSASAT